MRAGLEQYFEAKSELNEKDLRQWIFYQALPSVNNAREGIAAVRVLTLPSHRTLDKLDKDFEKIGEVAYSKFKKELKQIEFDIKQRNARNRGLGRPIYPYLKPSRVSISIDI